MAGGPASGPAGLATGMHAGIGIAEAVHALHQRALGWALSRSLAPNSVTGISVMLGLCAAAWPTARWR